MFRQFWTDCAVIFGLACIGFAGITLPDWVILDAELASDAVPLSILLFCNEYSAFLLALAAFRTGAFLSFKPGQTIAGNLFLSGMLLFLVVAGLVAATSAWETRLAHARQRLTLLEQQSLQRNLAREPAHILPAAVLWTPVMAPSATIPEVSLVQGERIWTDGTLVLEEWGLTNTLLLSTNVRRVSWKALPGDIRTILPQIHPLLVSASFDARLAGLVRWPLVNVTRNDAGPSGRALFLLGLAFLAAGSGFLINRPGLSLFQRTASYLLFTTLVLLPVWLFHLWWLARPASNELASQTDGLVRGIATLALGGLVFCVGLLRRRRLEARSAQ